MKALSRLRAVCCVLVLMLTVAGCRPGPSGGGKVLRIGAILCLTGDMAKYGKTMQTGIAMAADEINKGQSGLRVEVQYEDDRLNAAAGTSAATKLIELNKVSAIIGPVASSVALAVAPIAERGQVVLVSPGASSPKFSTAGDYIFRDCVSDTYEGGAMAATAAETLKLRRLGVLYINNEFGVGLKTVFEQDFTRRGGTIVASEAFEQGGRDFRAQLSKLRALKPDAVYLIGYSEMIAIFKQATELGFKPQWLATTMLNDQSMVDKIGPGPADGTLLCAWSYDPKSTDPRTSDFVARFKQRSGGVEPDVFAANAYDAVYLLAEAAKARGCTPAELKTGLYGIRGYGGVTGSTTFDSNGDVEKPLQTVTIRNGRIVAQDKPAS